MVNLPCIHAFLPCILYMVKYIEIVRNLKTISRWNIGMPMDSWKKKVAETKVECLNSPKHQGELLKSLATRRSTISNIRQNRSFLQILNTISLTFKSQLLGGHSWTSWISSKHCFQLISCIYSMSTIKGGIMQKHNVTTFAGFSKSSQSDWRKMFSKEHRNVDRIKYFKKI